MSPELENGLSLLLAAVLGAAIVTVLVLLIPSAKG